MSERTVTVKGVAGLGNRLFTLAWAANLARTHKRIVFVDWSDGQIGPKGIDLFSEYFTSGLVHSGVVSDWRIHSTSEDAYYNLMPHQSLLNFMVKLGWLDSQEMWMRRSGHGPKYIFPFEIDLLLRKNSICGAHLPSKECQSELKQITFNNSTCSRFDKLMPADIGERVGLHIRHSDKKADVSFLPVISLLLKEKVFLATDSEFVLEKAKLMGLDFVCLTTILHDGKASGGIHHQAFSADEKRLSFEEGAMDMHCLTRCRQFYGQSNSSFSRVVKIWRGEKKNSQYWDCL